jgi:hypothetical protein
MVNLDTVPIYLRGSPACRMQRHHPDSMPLSKQPTAQVVYLLWRSAELQFGIVSGYYLKDLHDSIVP